MGAWGHRSFDNDDAADFGLELEARGWEAVQSALQAASTLAPDDYLEAPEASQALAAAEVVAAVKRGDLSRLPGDVQAAVAEIGPLPDPSLVTQAQAAVERVVNQSELQELWAEVDEFDAWRADVEALASLLR